MGWPCSDRGALLLVQGAQEAALEWDLLELCWGHSRGM
jgi:hypothetical protein